MQAWWKCRPDLHLLVKVSAKKRNVNVNSRRYQRLNLPIVRLSPWGIESSGNSSPAGPGSSPQHAFVWRARGAFPNKGEERIFLCLGYCIVSRRVSHEQLDGNYGEQVNIRLTLPLCCIVSVSHGHVTSVWVCERLFYLDKWSLHVNTTLRLVTSQKKKIWFALSWCNL